jgi:UDP-2-acetamido-3-amino-2,3-dideoxy-glucuronate N-acetyltransferase
LSLFLSEEDAMLPALLAINTVRDERGALSFAEIGGALPFQPRRFFLVHGVPAGASRGGHAHRRCEQYLVAVSGSVAVTLDDGQTRKEYLLERPDQAIHIPAGIWGEQRYQDEQCCLLVLASEPYDPDDYLNDYSEFIAFRKARP